MAEADEQCCASSSYDEHYHGRLSENPECDTSLRQFERILTASRPPGRAAPPSSPRTTKCGDRTRRSIPDASSHDLRKAARRPSTDPPYVGRVGAQCSQYPRPGPGRARLVRRFARYSREETPARATYLSSGLSR